MNNPIFQSVHQALSFSYLIQAHESSPESIMSVAIRRQLQEMGKWSDGPKTIHFDGLSPLEIRAQAAMVRLSVETLLPTTEANTIKARFGLSIPVIYPDGTRTLRFTPERSEAVKKLARWLAPATPGVSPSAIAFLVARHVGESKAVRPPLQMIAEQYKASTATLHRAGKKISERMKALEDSAIGRLEPVFSREGLVG